MSHEWYYEAKPVIRHKDVLSLRKEYEKITEKREKEDGSMGNSIYIFTDCLNDGGAESIKFFDKSPDGLKKKIAYYVLKNEKAYYSDYFKVCRLNLDNGEIDYLSNSEFIELGDNS